MFAILFEVLSIEIQEEIHHFAGWEGGGLGCKTCEQTFVNKLTFPIFGCRSRHSRSLKLSSRGAALQIELISGIISISYQTQRQRKHCFQSISTMFQGESNVQQIVVTICVAFGPLLLKGNRRRVPPCAVKTCAVRPVFGGVVGELRAEDPSNDQGFVKQDASPGEQSEAPRPRWKPGQEQNPGPENQESQHMLEQPRGYFPEIGPFPAARKPPPPRFRFSAGCPSISTGSRI